MTGALVILVALIVVGTLLYITDVKYFRHHHASASPTSAEESSAQPITPEAAEEICCGMHLVCEKTSLTVTNDEIIYYDDEELDRFSGRSADSYNYNETEEFRDVLMTLMPEDIAGWAKSVTLRKIELPSEVKDELLLIVSELRSAK